ncbi:MAG: toprim domain-containing protein [Gammaproteobacteria bacterium]|nr:toprim domain-containing protein [Gammaproteobacteria bacterium]
MAFTDKKAERIHMREELDRFKNEISLFNIAQERYGFEVNFKKSTSHNVQNENNICMTNGSDKMIVSKKDTWLYWDTSEELGVNNKIGGDIISFVQWQERGCNLGYVRKILREYLSGTLPQLEQTLHPKPTPKKETEKDIGLVIKTLNKLKPATQSDFLEFRNITSQTLNAPLFRDRVLMGYNKAIIFPHWNDKGVCGFEFKNEKFAGFSKHGNKGLWYSQIPKKLEQLIFVESSLEALSHYQQFKPTKAAYFTASGNWTPNTGKLIGKVIVKYPNTKIVAAFNNDKGGQLQTKKLTAIAQDRGRETSMSVEVPKKIGGDWNDSLKPPPPEDFTHQQSADNTKSRSLNRS